MADKESLLRLRLQAMNEANPAFEGLSQSMNDLINIVQETSRSIEESFRGITTITQEASRGMVTSLDEEGRGVNELRNTIETSFTEAANGMASSMREMINTSQEDSRVMNESFRSMEEGLSAVVLAVRENTNQASEAFAQMGRASQTAHEQSVGLWHDMGGIIGLQMMADEARKAGETLGHMFEGAISSAADFEGNISRIHAVLMHREPTANMQEMAEMALKLGSNSKFSANEIAQGMYDLARQGLSATQIMGDGVNGAIQVTNNLAQSTDQSMSETAKVITDVMHEFNLSGQELAKVGDIISGAMHTSSITMNDFYYSMRQVGPVASNMHQSVNDVSTAIALLAQHGISGSQAGTSLKNMLLGLEPHTKKAAELMKELGINAKDGASDSFYQLNGNLKPLPEIIGILNEKFGGLNDKQKEAALSATFTKYGLAGLNTVVMEGKDKFEELKKTLMDEKSADIAGEKLNNLQGDMLRLHAATQTMAKSFGDTLQAPMRSLAQTAQGVVKWLTDLSPETKKVIMVVGGLSAATLILAGTLGSAAIAITLMQPGFATLGVAVRLVGSAFTSLLGVARMAMTGLLEAVLANPVAAAIVAIVAVVAFAAYEIYKHWDQVKAFLNSTWKTIETDSQSIWSGISSFFVSIGKSIENTWHNTITAITNLWNGFTSWISNAAHTALQFVVDAFQWMYNHNYYFQDLVDFIRNAWNTIKQDATTIWNNIQSFFSTTWTNISTTASNAWNSFKSAMTALWNGITTGLKNIWNPISSFFSGLWDGISTSTSNTWNSITSSMNGLWQGLVNDAENIFNSLENFFTGLWNKAYNWGSNLVHMVAQGIQNAAHEVEQAASNVAHSIATFLGFHSPTKDGPGSDADTWAPNFVNMFSGGLQEGARKVQYAANLMITPLANQITGLGKGSSPVSNTMTINNNGSNRGATQIFYIEVKSQSNNGKQIGTDIATTLRQQYNFAI